MSKQASSATLADVARMAVEQVLLQHMANFGYSDAVASSFSLWHIPYSGKLSRRKLPQIGGLWLHVFAKVLFEKFWGVASFGTEKASNPQKFPPSKVFRYSVDPPM